VLRLRDAADWFEGAGFVVQLRCTERIRHRFVCGVLGFVMVVYWCVRFVFDELIVVISDLEHVIVMEKK